MEAEGQFDKGPLGTQIFFHGPSAVGFHISLYRNSMGFVDHFKGLLQALQFVKRDWALYPVH